MESTTEQESCNWSQRKTRRQLTAKREDSPPHSAARTGNLALMRDMITRLNGKDSREEFLKQNQSGETALYVASEYGFQEIVSELMKYHDTVSAGIKAKNGYDSLHIAAKQGDVGGVSFTVSRGFPFGLVHTFGSNSDFKSPWNALFSGIG
ncbi:Ankyrin repeat-containing protein [Platanthera guangdongensis]|uniref:Ankyrin repeat-containing protein n=1 Tax=Platanthera guangdongensis TaxID=2320717 RepID=A0ABR2MIQ1_9ASPA